MSSSVYVATLDRDVARIERKYSACQINQKYQVEENLHSLEWPTKSIRTTLRSGRSGKFQPTYTLRERLGRGGGSGTHRTGKVLYSKLVQNFTVPFK